MRCASCGFENPTSAKFCEECGAKLVRVCPACGKKAGAKAKFCSKCGAPLSATPPITGLVPSAPIDYTPPYVA
ncbi:zinc-ribbon domain-containing protein [Cupriavidus sp. IK-TO18]|uniref:zinc-ribbon domain-containing protein n=1 Tax=Cupriavidus sp. IK-TO18 TaxID=2782182 RepID=UPI001899A359|nr:zinc-ribbon domain-containing protein [Cupriavidus sp. IK-TO18]MBF6989209.1 zinc ribbon domain-containing protein [Cupriavidus sp. IK-TO18]